MRRSQKDLTSYSNGSQIHYPEAQAALDRAQAEIAVKPRRSGRALAWCLWRLLEIMVAAVIAAPVLYGLTQIRPDPAVHTRSHAQSASGNVR